MRFRWMTTAALSAAVATTTMAQATGAPPAGAPDAAAAPGAPTIELLDPGSEPRRELRYAPEVGAVQAFRMRTKLDSSMDLGGRAQEFAMPTTVVTYRTEVEEMTPEGNVASTIEIVSAELEDTPGAMPQQVELMKQAMASLEGITGRIVTTPRGIVEEATLNAPTGAGPAVRQQVESIEASLKQMTTPLPEEAVGQGARWKVTRTEEQQGLDLEQTTTYELTSLSEGAAELDLTMEQSADQQTITPPDNPGMEIEVRSYRGTGTGTAKLDFARPMAIEGAGDMKVEMVMAMPGAQQTMQQTIDVETEVTPVDADAAGGETMAEEEGDQG